MTDKAQFALFGLDLFGEPVRPVFDGALSGRFVVPPFSVLNARAGSWQERKRAWLSLGIRGELGRDAPAFSTEGNISGQCGTSIFDPVLCELAYRWFCPPGGLVLDPFAGGSVRGVVAHLVERRYWGCDLRPDQVAANEEQARTICPDNRPTWVCGDALDAVPEAPGSDFVFSCPPYGNLEVYSDNARDLSTMGHHAFLGAYRRIIMRACARLRPDRFACFVVGDFRDRGGFYRNFVSDTIEAFRSQGLALYNEMILITPAGSLPVRTERAFRASRKIGKTHQNVLVFVKGDPVRASRGWSPGP